jgi:hypothetical protein
MIPGNSESAKDGNSKRGGRDTGEYGEWRAGLGKMRERGPVWGDWRWPDREMEVLQDLLRAGAGMPDDSEAAGRGARSLPAAPLPRDVPDR